MPDPSRSAPLLASRLVGLLRQGSSCPFDVVFSGDRAAFLAAVERGLAKFGFVRLRGVLDASRITALCQSVEAFFTEAEAQIARGGARLPQAYLFNPGNMATSMVALDDFGGGDHPLARVVANSPAAICLRHRIGDDVVCSLTHSRLRKSYPQGVPAELQPPSTVAWHSDGSPGVGYFNAHILWVPFTPCNDDQPGIEFQLKGDDGSAEPVSLELEPGDAFFFTSDTTHRTALKPSSTRPRFSCDMRFFKPADIPERVHPKIAQTPVLYLRAFAEPPW